MPERRRKCLSLRNSECHTLFYYLLILFFFAALYTCTRENIFCKPLASERCLGYIIRIPPFFFFTRQPQLLNRRWRSWYRRNNVQLTLPSLKTAHILPLSVHNSDELRAEVMSCLQQHTSYKAVCCTNGARKVTRRAAWNSGRDQSRATFMLKRDHFVNSLPYYLIPPACAGEHSVHTVTPLNNPSATNHRGNQITPFHAVLL